MNRLFIALSFALLAACGNDKSPAAPSSAAPSSAVPKTTTTAVAVTVPNPVRMGQTAQATGTESLSDGQTRAIASGFLSDAPAVATVTNAGLVTGIANGRATIYVVTGGRQGQQVARVVPDYHGRWSGGIRVTSCTQTDVFAAIDFCEDGPVGKTFKYALSLSQSGEQMTAIVDFGEPLVFPSIAAPIREDGSSAFTPSKSVTDSGVTVSVDPTFNINSTHVGELTGTVNEVWRIPNVRGEARVVYDIVSTTRSASAPVSSMSDSSA